jgi:pimeloyl-ACP methyl ester carboxylesterase
VSTFSVNAPDGREITAEVWGAPHGEPVFLLHGTPGSRFGPRPRVLVLHRLGIRLIAYDRPGYGGSDRLPGRRVIDAAEDVRAVADALGIDRFAVVGRSGGGPHALACAALLGERVTRVAVLVCLAPRNAEGLDWYAGMAASNVAEYTVAEAGRERLTARLEPYAAAIRADPASMIPSLDPELPVADRRVVADFGIRTMMMSNFAEAFKISGVGWIDDALAFISDWGFDPADIRVPVLLWHGALDVFSPVAHTLWLADRIRTARLVVEPAAAHFGAVAVLPEVLSWLLEGASGPRAAA